MQPKKIGFTIGKFAPLHKGHQFLIETGLKEMDEFITIIYETNKIETPLEQRAKWIQTLYPQAKVILAHNPPNKYGLDQESVAIQMEYLTKIINQYPVTHFYSSEPYGEKVSQYLNIVDRRVDNQRIKYPISATNIRKEIEENRTYLSDIVYKDLKNSYQFKLGEQSTKNEK